MGGHGNFNTVFGEDKLIIGTVAEVETLDGADCFVVNNCIEEGFGIGAFPTYGVIIYMSGTVGERFIRIVS